jgi:hypothetical protein
MKPVRPEDTLVERLTRIYNSFPDDGNNCSFSIDDKFLKPVSGKFARLFKSALEIEHKNNEELRVLTWVRIILMSYASSGKLEKADLPSEAERALFKGVMQFVKKVLENDQP